MSIKTLISVPVEQEAELVGLRALIDRRGEGGFVDLEVGEAETRASLRGKPRARGAF